MHLFLSFTNVNNFNTVPFDFRLSALLHQRRGCQRRRPKWTVYVTQGSSTYVLSYKILEQMQPSFFQVLAKNIQSKKVQSKQIKNALLSQYNI